jgi:hypothetical protein
LVPQVGQLAKVRNRRAVIASVEAHDAGAEGRLHLVRVEYTDGDGSVEDTLLWEREADATLIPARALPEEEGTATMPEPAVDDRVRAKVGSALTNARLSGRSCAQAKVEPFKS